jgi:hypothetical protein
MKELTLNQIIQSVVENYLKNLTLDLIKRNFTEEFYSFEETEGDPNKIRKNIEDLVAETAKKIASKIVNKLNEQGIKSIEDFENNENEQKIRRIIADILKIHK